MTSSVPPELRMAHDIARQFAHLPMEEAAERVATHLEKFWPPPMRRRLAHLVAHEHPDADLLVQADGAGAGPRAR